MPTRPPKICAAPGCDAKTTARYCAKHAGLAKAKAWAGRTGSASSRGYGARWRKLCRVIKARDPFCRVCHRRPSTEVDHIIPKHLGGDDGEDNLQGICGTCHGRKSGREGHAASGQR